MKVYSEEFYISTDFEGVYDITENVEKIVKKSKIREGICLVFAKHTTCFVSIGEYEPNIVRDYLDMLEKIASKYENWKHNEIDGNAQAHLRSFLAGVERIIPITNNSLDLGTWQRIMLVEGDGPRRRKILVKILGIE